MLLAGSVDDLPGLAVALAWLPSDAYGQVVVEADEDDDLSGLHAPLRVTVQRVRPALEGPGLSLARSVTAWVEEWIPDEPDARRTVSIWLGSGVDALVPELSPLVERL